MYALSNHPTQRPARPRHLAGLGSSVQAPRDLEADLRRLRSRRNLDLISLGVSGIAGVASLGLFASGRYAAGYTLAAVSAVVGGVVTLIRISTDYDQQAQDLRRAAQEAALEPSS
jgi:hypothetical protein